MRAVIAPPPPHPVQPVEPPTFSVLIPAYQAAGTIAEAVQSALGQTARPHEVIVVDDGSTDDLSGALAPYRSQIRLLRQENRGGAAALNTAARAASAEFVVILDADDAYLPDRLEALGELAASRPDLDLLTTDAWFVLDGRRAGRLNGEKNPFPPPGSQRKAILRRCYLFAPAVRRRRVLVAGGWDESFAIAYDWDCWMRLILGGAAVGFVAEPLTEYRLVEGSLSAHRIESFRERVRLLEKGKRHPGLREEEKPWLAAALAHHSRILAAAEAEELTLHGTPEARRRWREIAGDRELGRRARLKAAGLALLPMPVARGIVARARRSGRSRAAGRRPA